MYDDFLKLFSNEVEIRIENGIKMKNTRLKTNSFLIYSFKINCKINLNKKIGRIP